MVALPGFFSVLVECTYLSFKSFNVGTEISVFLIYLKRKVKLCHVEQTIKTEMFL